jgi:hypothetical protein
VINFVFENINDLTNYVECADVNSSGIRRFAPSPLAVSMLHRTQYANALTLDTRPDRYIIATGVNHNPNEWTGSRLSNNTKVKNIFYHLNSAYLEDLRAGKAMLLFDQSLEGYQTHWLWQYFHEECDQYEINPRQVIYVTGNDIAEDLYNSWAHEHHILDKLTIISHKHFEMDVKQAAKTQGIDFQEQLDFKINNLEKIKTYNCLQKRLRPHRIWIYKYLNDNGLLPDGLVSMNAFASTSTEFEGHTIDEITAQQLNEKLPLILYGHNNNEHGDRYYIDRILPQVHLDSWVTVISEASVGDSELTIFLSEKAFKPIACSHPFIFMGNKGSLAKLREIGYKTFDGFIDETYDTLPTWERMQAITDAIKQIQRIENKIEWYNNMKPILEHNKKLLMSRENWKNPAYIKLIDTVKKYYENV